MLTDTTSIKAFIDVLPKVELHLHLVGTDSVPTVLELARRHPDGPSRWTSGSCARTGQMISRGGPFRSPGRGRTTVVVS